MPTRKYICDLRNDSADQSIIVPAIQSEFPSLSIFAIENHFNNPLAPVGRVVCTVNDVEPDLHDEIMARVPGIELAD